MQPRGFSRIDAHHHVWDLDVRDQPWIDPVHMAVIRRSFAVSEFDAAARGCDVTTAVLVQVLNQADETGDLLDIARASNLVAGVVGWADVTRPDVADQIARLRHRGPLVGLRHQLQAEPAPTEWLRRPEVSRGLRGVEEAGLAVDLMLRPAQFDAAVEVVREHPGLTFVVDHLGKPPVATGLREPWERGLRHLAREHNVVAKLSGLLTVAARGTGGADDLRPYTDVALDAFGPSRLMFGSDWPVCLLAADYPAVVSTLESLVADLAPDERDDIWANTARRVYPIGWV